MAAIYTGARMLENFRHSSTQFHKAILLFGSGVFHMSFWDQQIGLTNGLSAIKKTA